MRWIDYLPEIARKEPEEQRSEFTVPKLEGFEGRLSERRFREEQKAFSDCMLQIIAMSYGG